MKQRPPLLLRRRISFYPFLNESKKEKETKYHVHHVYPVGVKSFHHLTNQPFVHSSNTKVLEKIILFTYCLFSGMHYGITPDNNIRQIRT